MSGLVPGQKVKPTGQPVQRTLAGMRLIPASQGRPAIIPRPATVQARLVELLAVDPAQPP